MKKHLKHKSLLAVPQDEPELAGGINKMQQQLTAMEKKLDILISQSSKKSFDKSYSQEPSRSFNHFRRHDRGRQDNASRERTYTRAICTDCNKECEVPFKPSGDRPVYCKECFSKRKKGNLFNSNRDSGPEVRPFFREHRSDKGHAEKRQRPVEKKKPFFAHRKKRA
ncbi:MAG: CxxC-x17-CxxC domain-containing protein [Candidatus Omnitrophota bacterium]